MTAPDQQPQFKDQSGFSRRVALFAAASLALHVLLLLLFQAAGGRETLPPIEPVPVQLVELAPAPAEPAPTEAALEPPVPQEIPEPPPPEVPQEPEPQPETPPEPEIPEEPSPEPDIPDEPAEQPEVPEPSPTPEAPDTSEGAEMIAPDEAPEAGVSIPGLAYDGGRDTALAWFGHAVECVGLDVRYDDYCADVGPIYLAENDVPRLAPEVEAAWREMMANRPQSGGAIMSDGSCDSAAGMGPVACSDPNAPRLRDLMR